MTGRRSMLTVLVALAVLTGALAPVFGIAGVQGPTTTAAADGTLSKAAEAATVSEAWSVARTGDYAVVSSANWSTSTDLAVVDVSDPENPTEVATLNAVTEGALRELVVGPNGEYVYTVDSSGSRFLAFDLTDPTNPNLAASVSLPDQPEDEVTIDTSREVVYIGSNMGPWLKSVDVSDPSSPTVLDTVSANAGAIAQTADGNTTYVSGWNGDVEEVDTSDPAAMSTTGTTFAMKSDTAAESATITNDTLYIGGTGTVDVWDVSGSPTHARNLTAIDDDGAQVFDLVVYDTQLVAASGDRSAAAGAITYWSIADSATDPTLQARDTSDNTAKAGVSVTETRIYATDYDDAQLEVWNKDAPGATPTPTPTGSSSTSGDSVTIQVRDGTGGNWSLDATDVTVYERGLNDDSYSRIGSKDLNWEAEASFDGFDTGAFYRIEVTNPNEASTLSVVAPYFPTAWPDPVVITITGWDDQVINDGGDGDGETGIYTPPPVEDPDLTPVDGVDPPQFDPIEGDEPLGTANDSVRVRYFDGQYQTTALEYQIRWADNGTVVYSDSLAFDQRRGLYTTSISTAALGGGDATDYEVTFNATKNDTEFGGVEPVDPINGTTTGGLFAGGGGGGGGGPGGLAWPVLLLIAVAAYVVYRRRASDDLPLTDGGKP